MANRFTLTRLDGAQAPGARHAARLARDWDLSAEALLTHDPAQPLRAGRLARQVRQDIWRALRGQRGFAPMVEVTVPAPGQIHLRAGGSLLAGGRSATLTRRLVAVLDDPRNRARWLSQAARPAWEATSC